MRVVVDRARIGRVIRTERERQGLSQDDLGRTFGRTQAVVSAYEDGSHGMPIEQLEQIAAGLGWTLAQLLMRAGALETDLSVEDYIAGDPSLNDENKAVVLRVYRLSRVENQKR